MWAGGALALSHVTVIFLSFPIFRRQRYDKKSVLETKPVAMNLMQTFHPPPLPTLLRPLVSFFFLLFNPHSPLRIIRQDLAFHSIVFCVFSVFFFFFFLFFVHNISVIWF